ncbi:YpzG family protein [Mesobacillus maritimus]|uniref:YpzG family protein n=1 Tax=Mesobacillus maritimus TaxID=1643336 RepID=UPI00203EDC79|nr:YpzG family protein [Mesobacillus maritimus]MCM3585990.1 YpzG family protein [Mesobacillus maritimus]MCM3670349.1 YpzG family protein [Mesobacillus maritimus]
MSYRDFLDPQSQRFVKNTTRRKHLSSQINGETQRSQSIIRAYSDSKAHRMF